jgi:hypothetical protein
VTTTPTPTTMVSTPPPVPHRRRRYLLLGALAVVLVGALVATLALTLGGGGQPTATGSSAPASPTAAVSGPGGWPAGPDLVPKKGILFGAWAQPAGDFRQDDRVAAVTGLESAIGRKLDIVNTYRRFEDDFPTESDDSFVAGGRTLMLSWVVDDTLQVTSGQIDPQLTAWAGRMRDFNHPMLVRLRWEMDRPNLRDQMHSGADYVAAWRHVRTIFAAAGVRNVSWVWCPTVEGFAGGYAQDFYPGDAEVDWTCVDAYAGPKLRPLGEILAPYFAWAAQHPKPIIIGEYGVSVAWGGQARADWFAAAARALSANPLVKAVSYFDSDPAGNGPNKQYHLEGDPLAMAGFAALANDPAFRTG